MYERTALIRLASLAEQFSDASKKWPNLESIRFSWPEDDEIPMVATDSIQVGIPRGSHFCALVVGGLTADTPDRRWRPGTSTALVLRREFGEFKPDPSERRDPDTITAIGQRLDSLSAEGASAIFALADVLQLRTWLTEMLSQSRIGWQLAVHECIGGIRTTDGDVEVQKINDFFLASANAVRVWTDLGVENDCIDNRTNGGERNTVKPVWKRTESGRQADEAVQQCRLKVTVNGLNSIAVLDGTPYQILERPAQILDVLIKAEGKPKTGRDVHKKYRGFPADRVTRTLQQLPEEIRILVETKQGAGSWLIDDAWNFEL